MSVGRSFMSDGHVFMFLGHVFMLLGHSLGNRGYFKAPIPFYAKKNLTFALVFSDDEIKRLSRRDVVIGSGCVKKR